MERSVRLSAATPPVAALTSHLVAHRGLHGVGAPENSLEAFRRAAHAGYAIELDVHLTLDGELVVFHDHTLTRMCQRSEAVERLTRSSRLLTRLSASDQHIPTLDEVLDLVAGQVPVFVEIKARNSYSQLRSGAWLRTVEAVGTVLCTYFGPVGVMAWDPRQLRWFKENLPSVLRVQSGGVVTDIQLLPGLAGIFDNLRLNRFSDPHAISFNASLLPRPAVSRARRSGLPVLAWTVRSPETFERVGPLADNVIFENFAPSPTPLPRSATFVPNRWSRTRSKLAATLPGWRRMRSSERFAATAAVVAGLLLAVLAARTTNPVPGMATSAAILAGVLSAWHPRRWALVAVLFGAGGPLLTLAPGNQPGTVLVSVLAVLGAFTGAVLRTVRPPSDQH